LLIKKSLICETHINGEEIEAKEETPNNEGQRNCFEVSNGVQRNFFYQQRINKIK